MFLKTRVGRIFLKREGGCRMIKAINEFFDKEIKHQRIKKFGEHSKIRTVIREELIKLVQYFEG
jgi:hypothetical protein